MKKTLGVFVILWLAVACNSLPYKDDAGFLVSAQANSPEFPVYLNGKLCADSDGKPGFCAKRITSKEDLAISFDAQNYAYLLTLRCTPGIPANNGSAPANQPYSFTLTAADMAQFLSFTCIGEINPQDRTPPISAKFEFHISIVDAQYTFRETIHAEKGALVLGEFARDAWVFDGAWKHYSQTTVVPIKGDPSKVQAYSSSFTERFNYFNFQGPVTQ